jgi:branched-chain amino acid transport system substrate-binding protein
MDAGFFDKYLKARAGNGKVAIISENNDFGQLSVAGFKKLFGDQVVFADFFAMNQTDFNAIVANAKNSGAEMVCIASSNVEQWGNILRLMETAGFTPKEKCLMPGLLNLGGIKVAGKSAEGLFSADIYYPGIENDLNGKFRAAFEKKHNQQPEKIEALGFEGVWVIAQAIAKAGSDKDTAKIAEIIKTGNWTTPRGTVTFDGKGQASSGELLPIAVKDGKLVLAPK